MSDATPEPLISIAEAARQIGVNKSTLSRQVASKAIRSHDGKVRLSEVLEDRAANIDLTQSRRRPKTAAPAAKAPVAPSTAAAAKPAAAKPEPNADLNVDDVLVDGVMVPFFLAQAIKENYLARSRKLKFELDRGQLVDRAAAEKLFFEVARDFRDAWMSWPARVATFMASELGVEERTLAEILTKYVQQHLDELGNPLKPEFAAPDK